MLYLSDGETSKLISISSNRLLILVEKGIFNESMSLTVIKESSIFAKGKFEEILKDSLKWNILTVFALKLSKSIKLSFFCQT